jgi:hypothetical protein
MNITKLKNTFKNIGLLLLVALVFFMIAEIVVRFIYKDETVLFPRYHTDAQYGQFTLRRVRPNSEFWHTSQDGNWKFTTNKQGFRNYKNFNYKKPEGMIRVISLGDSHTQGFEVRQDYTFSRIIEKYLRKDFDNVEVINSGVSGFSTAEELLFLENEGIKYAPDFIVLGFYANDSEDNIKADLIKLKEDGNLEIQKKTHIPGVRIQNVIYTVPLVNWMSENSYFYSLLFNNTWNYFQSRLASKASDRVKEYAVPTQKVFSEYQIALTDALIKRMYKFCQKNDIKLIIIDIPLVFEGNKFKSSFHPSLLKTVQSHSDGYILSDALLYDFDGVAELHVPHGQRHISEFTHSLLGISAAKKIKSLIQ